MLKHLVGCSAIQNLIKEKSRMGPAIGRSPSAGRLLVPLLGFHIDALMSAPLGFLARFLDSPRGGVFLVLASAQSSQPCDEIPGLR